MDKHYRVLGLRRGVATEDDIKRAYRKKALLCHPDRNPNGGEAFKVLQDAYETALNDVKTAHVRSSGGGTAGTSAGPSSNFSSPPPSFASATAAAAGAAYSYAKATRFGPANGQRQGPSAPLFSEEELFGDAIPGGWRDIGSQQRSGLHPSANAENSGSTPPHTSTGGGSGADARWRRAHGSRVPVSAYDGSCPVPPPPRQTTNGSSRTPASTSPHTSPFSNTSAAPGASPTFQTSSPQPSQGQQQRRTPAPASPSSNFSSTQAQWDAFLSQEHPWKPSSPLHEPNQQSFSSSEAGEESAEERAYREALYLHRRVQEMHQNLHHQQHTFYTAQSGQPMQRTTRSRSHPAPSFSAPTSATTSGQYDQPPPPPPPQQQQPASQSPSPSPQRAEQQQRQQSSTSAKTEAAVSPSSTTRAAYNGSAPLSPPPPPSPQQQQQHATEIRKKEELYRQWQDVQASLHRKLQGQDLHPPHRDQTTNHSNNGSPSAGAGPTSASTPHPSNSNTPLDDPSRSQQQQRSRSTDDMSSSNGRGAPPSATTSASSFTPSPLHRVQDFRHQDALLKERRLLQKEYLRYRYTPDPADVGAMSDMEVYLLSELMKEVSARVDKVLVARLTRGPCSACKSAPRDDTRQLFTCDHKSICVECYAAGVLSCPLCGAGRADGPGTPSMHAAAAAGEEMADRKTHWTTSTPPTAVPFTPPSKNPARPSAAVAPSPLFAAEEQTGTAFPNV